MSSEKQARVSLCQSRLNWIIIRHFVWSFALDFRCPSCFLTHNAIKMKCEDRAIVKETRCKSTYRSKFLNKRIAGSTNIRFSFESSRSDFLCKNVGIRNVCFCIVKQKSFFIDYIIYLFKNFKKRRNMVSKKRKRYGLNNYIINYLKGRPLK